MLLLQLVSGSSNQNQYGSLVFLLCDTTWLALSNPNPKGLYHFPEALVLLSTMASPMEGDSYSTDSDCYSTEEPETLPIIPYVFDSGDEDSDLDSDTPHQDEFPPSKWDHTSYNVDPLDLQANEDLPSCHASKKNHGNFTNSKQLVAHNSTTTAPRQPPANPPPGAKEPVSASLPQPSRSNGRITKYAMEIDMAPLEIREFLAELRRYFVKEVNLERNAPPIARVTFDKAQERLLCKYTIYICYITYI